MCASPTRSRILMARLAASRIAGRAEDALAVGPHVQLAGAEVPQPRGGRALLAEDEHVALVRQQRLVVRHLAGPRAARVDDHLRADRAAWRDDEVGLDALDRGRQLDARLRDQQAQQRTDVDHAVARHVQRAGDLQLADRPPCEHRGAIADLDRHAEPLRARDIRICGCQIVEAEDAAGRRPHPGQPPQQRRAAHGQCGRVVVLGELAAEPGAASAREPAERDLAFQDDDVGDSDSAQRPGRGCACESAADDRDGDAARQLRHGLL